ncbi:putative quinol monooxygenase [Streptosporangium lutulentum]|uniref:Quinol monooxygenase YgiN n=1 Tax=Streptosporangium lutulentum TaxID=1461250 RepID=A0ABT9QFF5_9ACTN|nr:antibiotic biosynthesis monooxygenase family protein [Streptosporangium lutulentum]MDP9845488.1 quinol monooxygenase YgiN [Streptosporangium lutulentum]
MIIISGWLAIDPDDRDAYLQGCIGAVEQARVSPGCLDFALGADLIDAGRINVHERWESEEALYAFRDSGPDEGQTAMIRNAEVLRYQVSGAGPA